MPIRWSRCLKHGSAAARFLVLRVRILPGGMCVCVLCCELSNWSLCGPIEPSGSHPDKGKSTWWRTGGWHYKIAISCLGRWIPYADSCEGVWPCVSQQQTPIRNTIRLNMYSEQLNIQQLTIKIATQSTSTLSAYGRSISYDSVFRNITAHNTVYNSHNTTLPSTPVLASKQCYTIQTIVTLQHEFRVRQPEQIITI